MTQKYGAIYMTWGKNAVAQAKQSMETLWQLEPNMPVMAVGDQESLDCFGEDSRVMLHVCDVNPFDHDQKKGFKFLAGRVKPLLGGISPFERALYVDADTVFHQTPMKGLNLLDRWDMALAETETRTLKDGIAGKEECEATAVEFGTSLLLYHNSGMIFWKKNERTKALFDLWAQEWAKHQGWDEQVALLRALLRSDALYLTLPYTWNHSDVSNTYLVMHWFGAGDARFDLRIRNRQVMPSEPRKPSNELISVQIAPGQSVQCRPEERAKVLYQFRHLRERHTQPPPEERKEDVDYSNRGPLIKVPIDEKNGHYVTMYKKDAIEQGYLQKKQEPQENKMMAPAESKSKAAKVEHIETDEAFPPDDFTEISGVGNATDKAIHEHGIHTFDALADPETDIGFLPGKAQSVIEAWREAL